MRDRREKELKLDHVLLVSILMCALFSVLFFLNKDTLHAMVSGQVFVILLLGFLSKKHIDRKYKDLEGGDANE